MSVLAAIHRELNDAAMTGYKRIVHMRVTTDALPGSITSVPVTPERARALGRLLLVPDANGQPLGVVADPMDYEKMLELLIHPADWHDLLLEKLPGGEYPPGLPTRIMGIPVAA